MAKDAKLGQEIQKHLIALGLETPMLVTEKLSLAEKQSRIAASMLDIMKTLGLDYTNDSMVDTPKRIARMYTEEVFMGLDYDNFPKIMSFENAFKNAGMVVERGIKVNGACSHHFVPTIGYATVGYIPKDRIIGLSKLNRIVDFFSRRPAEQERLVLQIHATLCYLLDTEDIAVTINAKHYCVSWRGVQDPDSKFVTSKITGRFMDDSTTRSEFYNLASL